MGKKRKQSLASRKRSKDFSSALAENAYAYDPRSVDKFDDAAIPRSMRNLMRSIQMVKDREAGKEVKVFRSREDLPPKEFGKSGARAKGKRTADVTPESDKPHALQNQISEVDSKRSKREAKQTEKRARDAPVESARHSKRPSDRVSKKSKVGTMFGETNERPPELILSGQLANKAARAARDASAQSRTLQMQRDAALKNYAAAKAKRAGSDPSSNERQHKFAAPFMSFPS